MVNRLTTTLFGLMLLALLPSIGCSPAAKKPEPSTASTTPGAAEGESGKGKGIGESSTRSTSPSSLEQQRRGESTATPGSSPLKEIYFDFDKHDLRQDAREVLKANADWLKANPAARVEIEGHCDERGTSEYNLALGAKRAQAAKDYLVTLGISAERLSTISYGQELPVCKEHTEDCWQRNRRDRFVVVAQKPAS